MVASVVLFASIESHLGMQVSTWITLALLAAGLVYGVKDARQSYKRTALAVARYQQGVPALDFARSLRDLWRTPGAPKALLKLVFFFAEFIVLAWLAIWLLRR
jgi:hypothetical protein